MKKWKPEIIINLGDHLDCYCVSTYSKSPDRVIYLEEEAALAEKGLRELKSLGAKRNIFIAGNHEARLDKYLIEKAPAFLKMIDIPGLLKLKENGWKYVPYKDFFRLGKILFTHDLQYAGRYAAHRALDAAQHSVIVGHTHRLSMAVEGDAAGHTKIGASFGWLGDANMADYMHRLKANKDWALGFGIGYIRRDSGIIHFQAVPIIDYTCEVEGVLYRG